MDCVFCAIAAGRVPTHMLYEDNQFVVLLDLYPLRPAHLLVVAREHATYLHQLSESAQQSLMPLAERMQRVLRRAGYGRLGINLLVNDGPAANQHVEHFHLHLIPRELNDLPAMALRFFTRFLPLGRRRMHNRLERELHQLREAMLEEN
ncbi:HIT family protein [Pseudomonas sp. SCB32]|uniref:HIT family protein n=1 Tax=Pseudomonas sp. SCB32 TaxID=2653853 RepID=UPI001265656C|nr:HIT family protein [Pseudomonas sp. SCB32]